MANRSLKKFPTPVLREMPQEPQGDSSSSRLEQPEQLLSGGRMVVNGSCVEINRFFWERCKHHNCVFRQSRSCVQPQGSPWISSPKGKLWCGAHCRTIGSAPSASVLQSADQDEIQHGILCSSEVQPCPLTTWVHQEALELSETSQTEEDKSPMMSWSPSSVESKIQLVSWMLRTNAENI